MIKSREPGMRVPSVSTTPRSPTDAALGAMTTPHPAAFHRAHAVLDRFTNRWQQRFPFKRERDRTSALFRVQVLGAVGGVDNRHD